MANDPSALHPAVSDMAADRDMIDALMGGTDAMRAAGETYLPRFPKEEKDENGYDPYEFRLSNSTLLPGYSQTVINNTGRVFAEPITFDNDVPKPILDLTDDIDRQGNNLQVWAQTVFAQGLAQGIHFGLADFPDTTGPDGQPQYKTRADELKAGVRPFAVTIALRQVLGWKESGKDGIYSLQQFRYMEMVEEDDPKNEFNVIQIQQIRVLEPGSWRTYRKSTEGRNKGKWELHNEGSTSLDFIPLATLYTGRTGFMQAKPPLLELAHLNVKHWRSQSDQDNILHVARVPILVGIGVEDGVDENGQVVPWEMTIGSSSAVRISNADGNLQFVEHTGAAIEAGRTSLKDLVDEMRMAGAKLLQSDKQQTKTATQASEEAAQENSPLETMASNLEDFIDLMLFFFASFMGEKKGGHCKVHGNFDIDYAPETNMPFLKSMADAGYLSQETLFAEVQRRSIISPDLVWEEEKQRINDQGPALGGLGGGPTPNAGGAGSGQ